MQSSITDLQVAVVIPCYKVVDHILGVIAGIGPECHRIYVVDDCCPHQSGEHVKQHCRDPRVQVIRHTSNQGVGGAMITGYQAALAGNMDIVVKLDGDGQMDATLLPDFLAPIQSGEADYCKGNRFFDLEGVRTMPKMRLIGNAVLSFMTKLSSGYWNLFDPTNGYTAIHCSVLRHLPLHKISHSYFFETDMLFRLNTIRAVAVDVPMAARYGSETSSLRISSIVGEFAWKHLRNFCKRIFYNYYLRDMSVASLELPLGLLLTVFGASFGAYHWIVSSQTRAAASTGTVMLAALPILMGIQLLLAFLGADIASVPTRPLQRSLRKPRNTARNAAP
jgi:dolichol-phosphate mannosyltransferase